MLLESGLASRSETFPLLRLTSFSFSGETPRRKKRDDDMGNRRPGRSQSLRSGRSRQIMRSAPDLLGLFDLASRPLESVRSVLQERLGFFLLDCGVLRLYMQFLASYVPILPPRVEATAGSNSERPCHRKSISDRRVDWPVSVWPARAVLVCPETERRVKLASSLRVIAVANEEAMRRTIMGSWRPGQHHCCRDQ